MESYAEDIRGRLRKWASFSPRIASPRRASTYFALDETAPISDEDLLDQELLHSLETEELPDATLERVQTALAKIPDSMTSDFLAEREERRWEQFPVSVKLKA
jgi:hypothetical protein